MSAVMERQPSIPAGTPWRPVLPDLGTISSVLASARGVQWRYDHTRKPEKLAAKQFGANMLRGYVTSGRLLDIGGEEFYHKYFSGFEIETYNLPDHDMHELDYEDAFDAIVAMHVLEHSPFPMLVLALMARALKPSGFAYIAVPRPCRKFCFKFGHWSVMSATMWKTVIQGAGLEVVRYAHGKFGPKRLWIEERFLCRRAGIAL